MRARPREINIFNMSLLDILCGALGAFCFMMLVALPYYVVGKADHAQSQKRTEELLREADQLRERMSDPAQAEQLRKLIEELEAQIKQLQGELNQLSYDNEQLKGENSRLTSERRQLEEQVAQLVAEKAQLQEANQRLAKENETNRKMLEMRRPFVVMAGAADPTQDLALFLEEQMIAENTNPKAMANARFEPYAINQNSGWPEDITNFGAENRGVTLWVSGSTILASRYLVFVKYRRPPLAEAAPSVVQHLRRTPVFITCFGDFAENNRRASVRLEPERFWTLVGSLTIDADGKLTLKEATEAERDEAWRTRMKTAAVPTPAPSPSPSGSLSVEEMERIRKVSEEQRRKYQNLRNGQQASPAPTP